MLINTSSLTTFYQTVADLVCLHTECLAKLSKLRLLVYLKVFTRLRLIIQPKRVLCFKHKKGF